MQEFDFFIGIPTYKRARSQTTLDYLEKLGIEKERIVMSVQCAEDDKEYREAGVDKRVGAFIYRDGKNVSENTNTILDYVPSGARVVLLDDDIKSVCWLSDGKLKDICRRDDFFAVVRRGYALADKHATTGFCVYPVCNAFFMKNGYETRALGIGTLLAVTNNGERFDRTLSVKQDYEYILRAIKKHGAFIRLNGIACNAKHYTKGGCEEFWEDKQRNMWIARNIVRRYPELVKLNPNKPGEIMIIRKGGNKNAGK